MQNTLISILPFIIFSFLFYSLHNIGKNSISFVILLVCGVCTSNFLSTMISYMVSFASIDDTIIPKIDMAQKSESLQIIWEINLCDILSTAGLDFICVIFSYISNDFALFSGALCGLIGVYTNSQRSKKISASLMNLSLLLLNKIIIPVMPIFILGFMLKMQHDDVLHFIAQNYLKVFLVLILCLYGYIALMYMIVCSFKLSKFIKCIKNILPAAFTGFCTMSSAAALPLLIKSCEDNTQNTSFSRASIPSIVNIHLIGDCFSICIMAIAIMLSYGMELPGIETYITFAIYFVIAKFAVAAVPGGGIIVMIPILAQYLDFSPEMISLITVLYIMFDPVITSANIAGNGAFCILLLKIHTYITSAKWPTNKTLATIHKKIK